MGLRVAYSLGEHFKVIIWEASYKGMGLFFAGGSDPSRQDVNILILQLEDGRNA